MKKRMFSIFLVLALLLAALAGCGQDNGSSKSSGDDDEEAEQLLTKGYYMVYDEDDDPVGYLYVTSSKITVYDKNGNEDTLRYDYNEKKDLYIIEDGELFGSEEFTVEKSKKKLKLITEDDDEYTLEEIDEDELPGGKDVPDAPAETPRGGDSDYIELPAGSYAAYDGRSLAGYLKVSGRTMIVYDYDGYQTGEYQCSYDRDGQCVVEDSYETFVFQFTYERGEYNMYHAELGESVRLEPISEIPEYEPDEPGSDMDEYYIGNNGSIGLYAWLPEELLDEMDVDSDRDSFTAMAQSFDYDAGMALIFSAVLASGDNLEMAIDAARADTGDSRSSDSDLLFSYLRDNMVGNLDSGYFSGVYLGDDLDYDVVEDNMTVNGRNWRYCDLYITADDGVAYVSMMFWMDGDDMALVILGGITEDIDNSSEIYDPVWSIAYSLDLDT